MSEIKKLIHVRGDVSIDWLLPEDELADDQYTDSEKFPPHAMMGGAWYYAAMIKAATRKCAPLECHTGAEPVCSVDGTISGVLRISGASEIRLQIIESKRSVSVTTEGAGIEIEGCERSPVEGEPKMVCINVEKEEPLTVDTLIDLVEKISKEQRSSAEGVGSRIERTRMIAPIDVTIEFFGKNVKVVFENDCEEAEWRLRVRGVCQFSSVNNVKRLVSLAAPISSFNVLRKRHETSFFELPDKDGNGLGVYIRSLAMFGDCFEEISLPAQSNQGTENVLKNQSIGKTNLCLSKGDESNCMVETYDNRSALAFLREPGIYRQMSNLSCFREPSSPSGKEVYRIRSLRGFYRLRDGINRPRLLISSYDPKFERHGASDPDILAICDYGLGFRKSPSRESARHICLDHVGKCKNNTNKSVVISLGNIAPDFDKIGFWRNLKKKKLGYSENRVFVVGVNLLRRAGLRIPRRISWEKTLEGLRSEIEATPNSLLKELCQIGPVVVRFGIFAAARIYKVDKVFELQFLFDSEHPFRVPRDEAKSGYVVGYNAVFTSCLVDMFANSSKGERHFSEAIKRALCSCQKLFQLGYGSSSEEMKLISYNRWVRPEVIVSSADHAEVSRMRSIHTPREINSKKYKNWTILKQAVGLIDEWDDCAPSGYNGSIENFYRVIKKLEKKNFFKENAVVNKGDWKNVVLPFAEQIVHVGLNEVINKKEGANVPCSKYGILNILAKDDVENFGQIANVMRSHLSSDSNKPVSIAVFGSPGSGKSFGITQIAKSLGGDDISLLEFNVSQFRGVDDLQDALFRVGSVSSAGKVPLVFFDEFDSTREGRSLGWLKLFLQPMQDGSFSYNQSNVTLGKCIFIFAGGTFCSYRDFCEGYNQSDLKAMNDHWEQNKQEEVKHSQVDRASKRTDFVSRVRTSLDISGLNLVEDKLNNNIPFVRRAILLRSMLEKREFNFVNQDGVAILSKEIVRKFLTAETYIHGARSMESVLSMFTVYGRKIGEASLPHNQQIERHITGWDDSV